MSGTSSFRILLFLSLFALTVFHCGDGTGARLEVIGIVVDGADLNPLAGVLGSLTGTERSVTTDSAGRFTLDHPPREEFFMYFTKDNYKGQIVFLNLTGAEGINPIDTVFLARDTGAVAGPE